MRRRRWLRSSAISSRCRCRSPGSTRRSTPPDSLRSRRIPLPPSPRSTSCRPWPVRRSSWARCCRRNGVAAAACVTVNVCPWTTTDAERAAPVFARMDSVTVPLPDPIGLPVTLIHGACVTTAQPQLRVATENSAVPPVASTVADAGSRCMRTAQPTPPADLNRLAGDHERGTRGSPALLSTWKLADPEPLGFCVPVTEIHGTALAAAQRQPSSVCTVAAPSPPPASNVNDAGVTANSQGAAAWLSSACASPTTTLAGARTVRDCLRAAHWTVPSPWPVAPDVIVSHDAASLDADHVHDARSTPTRCPSRRPRRRRCSP